MTPRRVARQATRCAVSIGLVGALGPMLLAGDAGALEPPQERRVTLERVVDGDTLKLRDGERVRLIGINTPEVENPYGPEECFGPEASRAAERMLHPGDQLRLVFDRDRYDQYGRLLAYVYRVADGLFVNARLLKRGFAEVELVAPNDAHATRFRRLEREARDAGRGLWSACDRR